MGALTPYRVLELAGECNQIGGYVLATLGAEVISVEPPGGSSTRQHGPFVKDRSGQERSLQQLAYGRGKKSVTLDLASDAGRDELIELARGSDILIEAMGQPSMAMLGLDYATLSALVPELVYVSLSGFGNAAGTEALIASDLAILAGAGTLRLAGDADRAPCRLSVPQAWLHAGAMATAGALAALYERAGSGLGQHVDVSAQQVCTICAGGWVLSAPANTPPTTRVAGGSSAGGIEVRYVWPAKDGFVSITHLFGPAFGPYTRRLMEWVHEAGFCSEQMRDLDWIGYGQQLAEGVVSAAEFAAVRDAISAFTASRNKAELFAEAVERRVLLAPVNTIEEVVGSEQLAARDYWEDIDYPDLDVALRHPGRWARFSATPLQRFTPAPGLGAHNHEVLGRRTGRTSVRAQAQPRTLPLAGVKIIDLTRSYAGPTVGRLLADLGATVVRVESSHALDPARSIMPFLDNEPGVERSVLFSSLNAGKLGLTLDLKEPAAQEVMLDLARWGDVLIESFSPGMMDRLGLGYDSVAEVNPRLLVVSTSLMGQTGPMAQFAGYGNLAAALCGFTGLLGWPDRAPAGPFAAYTDYVSPHFMAIAVLAGLDYRRRTGHGQHVDISQAEASLHFLAPALLDYAANGRVAARAGNADPEYSPHGVYRAAGDDEWVTVTCATDAQWQGLCRLMGRGELAADPGLATLEGRLARRAEVDSAVQDWTSGLHPATVANRLQLSGISAHSVLSSEDCLHDRKLAERNHFVEVDHPALGPHVVEGLRFRLSATPGGPSGGGPMLNQHLSEVLYDLLGYDEDRVIGLIAQDIFQ